MKYYGLPAVLMIGVNKEAGKFAGHAWVEWNGKVVIGESSISHVPISSHRVTPLLS